MDNNNPWYTPSHPNYNRDDARRLPPPPNLNNAHPMNSFANPANHSVQDAQRLLASYPPASATPTMHSVRHLASMNMTAAPPSFVQPGYYSSQRHPTYSNVPPPPYSEYDRQMAMLSAAQASPTEFWQTTRDQSVRILNEQERQSYPYHEPVQHQGWPQSSHQSSAFAQSVLQRTAVGSVYPTPPPPSIPMSSSSLAHALGPPIPPPIQMQQQAQHPPMPMYLPSGPPGHMGREHLPMPPHTTAPRQAMQPQTMHLPPHPTMERSPMSVQQSRSQPGPQHPMYLPPPVVNHSRMQVQQSRPQQSPISPQGLPVHREEHSPMPQPVPHSSRPQQQPNHPSVHPVHKAEQSPSFFNEFLQRKTQQMQHSAPSNLAPVMPLPPPPVPPQAYTSVRAPDTQPPLPIGNATSQSPETKAPPHARHKTPPTTWKLPVTLSSPDPLALKSSMSPPSVTPQKRKLVVEIQSPSHKRMQGYKPLSSVIANNAPRTPSGPIPLTPSSKRSQASRMSGFPASASTSITSMSPKTPVPMTPTPKRIGRRLDDTPDLGGYGSSEDTPLRLRTGMTGSVRRAGDRDERGPLEKLIEIVEEIFNAEDSLPADPGLHDMPCDYFSALSTDFSRPLLSQNTLRKLLKYIGQVARPTKRMRQAGVGNSVQGMMATPRIRTGRMSDVDVQVLSRLLKLLERSLKQGEDLDPFKPTSTSTVASGIASARSSPTKKTARKKKVKSANDDDDAMDVDEDEEPTQRGGKRDSLTPAVDEAELETLTSILEMARDSVLAADCAIAILASDRLPKQLYSEELITSCLSTVKNQLTKVLYPFVEASSPDSINARMYNVALLQHIGKADPGSSVATNAQAHHRRQLSDMFTALSSVLPRINALANAETVAMSDSIIIQAVYIAIGPFFVVDNGGDELGSKSKQKEKEKENVVNKTLGKSAMRGLRLDALSLIRSIFSNHEDQRSWIIEEILTSLIKLSDTKQKAGQFRLRDGRSIRTVSALLLQLVQTSAHDVRISARRLHKERSNRLALKRQESLTEVTSHKQDEEPFLDDIDTEEIRLYGSGLDSAMKAAKTIILFLNSRAGKGKATKNSNEAEYRAIFDNLMDDLLVVLYWPEWPAASLLLSVACKFMVSSLDDVKNTNAQADSNAAKTMALDHLGVIAARIRTSVLKVKNADEGVYRGLKPLDEIVSNMQVKQFSKFLDAHRNVAAHLLKRSSEDQAYDSARELTAAMLGQELSASLKKLHLSIENGDDDEDLNLKDNTKLLSFGEKVKIAMQEVWKDPVTDVFEVGSQEEVSRIERLSEEIGTIQSLKNSFQPILNVILMALDAPAIFMRTKALRALGQIVTSDASILGASNVRQAIENHLLDSSPAVRDAAVELIGKYMIDTPEVAGGYYSKIAERIADTGLAVRKRVIKLLKAFYTVTEETMIKADISRRLVYRMGDEDDGVKDLALKSVEELWFPPLPLQSAMKTKSSASNPQQERAALLTKVSIIMTTASSFRDRQSPLEDLLHRIMADKEGNEAASLHKRYAEICEALIDGLVDASDLPNFTVNNCIRTIHLFTAAYPQILSVASASTLLPYLKNPSTNEELLTSDCLLKIFRVSVPHMPKTAAKFGQELQAALQPMIIKPSPGPAMQIILQEAIGCICAVVQHLTHDFIRLINLLKGCNAKLVGYIHRSTSRPLAPADVTTITLLTLIVSLLGEHCNYDRLRNEHPNFAADVDSISQDSIMDHIYITLLQIYEKYDDTSLRGRMLTCLGFLFRAQPTLMTNEESALIMDAIFASDEEEGRARLLKIMQDFLISESEKHVAKEKETAKNKNKAAADVNMEELVGNTDGFADSGVSSAILQRYLTHILQAALSQNAQIQNAAVDVLTFTIKQGLAHPLQSFPVIIALETSPVFSLSSRATALHSTLNAKHASLLNARQLLSARQSFDYQKSIVGSGVVRGFRTSGPPVALLQRWYSLVREKRSGRQDFLKSLVKVFSENDSYQATQDSVDFTRYMAENFASFEYKTQEEVFTIVKYLTTVLSTTGVQLLDIISPSHLLSHLQPAASQLSTDSAQAEGETEAMAVEEKPPQTVPSPDYGGRDPVSLMRTSVIIAMVMLLKSHLKTLYGLSEDKCNKFVIGKKSAIGDRPTTKRNDKPISWEKLPHAMTPILSAQDVELQKERFLEIWNEDGVSAEPEDELEFL